MGLETFPEIESFQKLPHRVIVKGGNASYHPKEGAELRGIVINNIGHPIRDLKISVVIFDEQKIPVYNTSIVPEVNRLAQGAIVPFIFLLKDYPRPITDYYLYPDWKFDD